MCNVDGSWPAANQDTRKGRARFQKGIAKLAAKGSEPSLSPTRAVKAQAHAMVGASLHEAKAAWPALSKATTD